MLGLFAREAVLGARAPSLLVPGGPGAARIAGLWWVMFAISLVVFAVVTGMLVASVLRRRRADPGKPADARWGEPFIVIAGVVIPAIILGTMFVVSLRAMADLEQPAREADLEVRVIGRMWWWEARYPGGAVTANEIHIPAGRPVRLALSSEDVIHSFWVPELQAKADMVPGREIDTWIQADKPGRYRGQCAEFCGVQHAQMIFWVVADPPAEFERWLEHEAEPAEEPRGSAARGRDVFLAESCVGCHAISGTPAESRVGPDLTHFAGRRTVASGVLPNTREDVSRWIVDPQSVKPGAVMPPTELSRADLEALLDYLESLD